MLKETIYQKNSFQIFVVLIPYLSFLNVNNQELDLVIYQTIVLMFLATIVSIFLLSKIIYLVFKQINYRNIQFFLSFGFYTLFFLYAFFIKQTRYLIRKRTETLKSTYTIAFLGDP